MENGSEKDRISEVVSGDGLSELFQAAWYQWKNSSGENGYPDYKNFHLDELPLRLVPWVIVVDVDLPTDTFTYRFWGTERTNLIGAELSGKTTRDIRALPMREGSHGKYLETCERKVALLCQTPIITSGGRSITLASLRLPFFDTDGNVTQIFSMIDPNELTYQHYEHFGTPDRSGIC